MNGARCRLAVTTLRDGVEKERWVSPNIITEGEAPMEIAKEAFIHALAGWDVEFANNRAVCSKEKTRRVINVIRFPAMADVVTAGVQDHP